MLQDPYPENYKMSLTEIKTQRNGEIHHIDESEHSVLLRCQLSLK